MESFLKSTEKATAEQERRGRVPGAVWDGFPGKGRDRGPGGREPVQADVTNGETGFKMKVRSWRALGVMIRACVVFLRARGRFGEFCAEECHDRTRILKGSGCCVDNSLSFRTSTC